MKAICIQNIATDLVIGNIYDITELNIFVYNVVDDSGKHIKAFKSCFKLLSDLRDERLNELGIWI